MHILILLFLLLLPLAAGATGEIKSGGTDCEATACDLAAGTTVDGDTLVADPDTSDISYDAGASAPSAYSPTASTTTGHLLGIDAALQGIAFPIVATRYNNGTVGTWNGCQQTWSINTFGACPAGYDTAPGNTSFQTVIDPDVDTDCRVVAAYLASEILGTGGTADSVDLCLHHSPAGSSDALGATPVTLQGCANFDAAEADAWLAKAGAWVEMPASPVAISIQRRLNDNSGGTAAARHTVTIECRARP